MFGDEVGFQFISKVLKGVEVRTRSRTIKFFQTKLALYGAGFVHEEHCHVEAQAVDTMLKEQNGFFSACDPLYMCLTMSEFASKTLFLIH